MISKSYQPGKYFILKDNLLWNHQKIQFPNLWAVGVAPRLKTFFDLWYAWTAYTLGVLNKFIFQTVVCSRVQRTYFSFSYTVFLSLSVFSTTSLVSFSNHRILSRLSLKVNIIIFLHNFLKLR